MQLDSIYNLKKHIFKQHSEVDVQAQYGQSIERYVGQKYMK